MIIPFGWRIPIQYFIRYSEQSGACLFPVLVHMHFLKEDYFSGNNLTLL